MYSDPVSRFHLRNGSSFHGMHWAGHMTQPSRVQQSAGNLGVVIAIYFASTFNS